MGTRRTRAPRDHVVSGDWPNAVLDGDLAAMVAQNVSARLERLLAEEPRSQSLISRSATINRQTIVNVVEGRAWPTIAVLADLERALGTTSCGTRTVRTRAASSSRPPSGSPHRCSLRPTARDTAPGGAARGPRVYRFVGALRDLAVPGVRPAGHPRPSVARGRPANHDHMPVMITETWRASAASLLS
jgi:hypothetical protein